jgi:hypothetical protein
MSFDFTSFTEDPTFMFFFHEIVCILASIYYLVPTITRIREKKEGLKYTTSWKSLKEIVALYVVLAESVFLYEDVKTGGIINIEVAVVTQTVAIIIIAAAFIILREEPKDGSMINVKSSKKRR